MALHSLRNSWPETQEKKAGPIPLEQFRMERKIGLDKNTASWTQPLRGQKKKRQPRKFLDLPAVLFISAGVDVFRRTCWQIQTVRYDPGPPPPTSEPSWPWTPS